MIHIYVDYQGKPDKTYSFNDTGIDFQNTLDYLESYNGKIDEIKIFIGSNIVSPLWDENPKKILFTTSNINLAVKRARKLSYPSNIAYAATQQETT